MCFVGSGTLYRTRGSDLRTAQWSLEILTEKKKRIEMIHVRVDCPKSKIKKKKNHYYINSSQRVIAFPSFTPLRGTDYRPEKK